MPDPIRCWAWYEGSRTTAPPVRTVADLGDPEGERMSRKAKIEIEVSLENEGTADPYWFIVDPKQNMGLSAFQAATQITGPFFSREEGEAHLRAARHHFSHRAVVWCHSGCYSGQYSEKYREAERVAKGLPK